MPRITIHEDDQTGAEYSGSESVVFVPGSLKILNDLADTNNCVYISASNYHTLKDILDLNSKKPADTDSATELFVRSCLSHNLDVIYCYVEGYGGVHVGDIDKNTYNSEDPGARDAAIAALPLSREVLPGKIKITSDEENYHISYEVDLSFLYDKDNYNVKFLTTGCLSPITCTTTPDAILQDADGDVKAIFDFTDVNKLGEIAFARKDCVVLASVAYDIEKIENGNEFANQLRKAINDEDKGAYVTAEGKFDTSYGSYCYILIPNIEVGSAKMPGYLSYLMDYGDCLNNGQEWLPIANSTRGGVAVIGKPDLKVTKYYVDNAIIKDDTGISFNSIVYLRPYGDVIWGDRTLLKLSGSVKATAYMSLRMLVCDISKRAYQSAVRNTYESNNTVTWFNFKSRITDLLGEAVASGVLRNYAITREPADTYNTIICRITLYPNLPVENFDIYIDLRNAEINLEEGAEE